MHSNRMFAANTNLGPGAVLAGGGVHLFPRDMVTELNQELIVL
jgi:hypothetical protein